MVAIAAGAAGAGSAAGSGDATEHLGASLAPRDAKVTYRPGDPVTLTGRIFELTGPRDLKGPGVPATFSLRTVDADGETLGTFGPYTAAADGSVELTLPARATSDVDPDASSEYREVLGVELVDASYGSTETADGAPAGQLNVIAPPTGPVLENSFVSSVGWVKPGERYPFTLTIANYGATPILDAVVTLTAPDSTTLTDPDGDGAGVTLSGNTLTWNAGTVAGISGANPGEATLVVEAQADGLEQDPQIVWKNLSTTGSLTYTGAGAPITAVSHGPKVIPPFGGYETARYGDRPFPVVPVDYFERKHDAAESGSDKLDGKINDPANPGSTFNLYQEMSYGQLFPNGTVPSDGIAAADWNYGPGFDFTKNTVIANTCHGATTASLPGDTYQSLSPNRIQNGWYQLPGSTDYYGDDSNGSAYIGAVAGIGALQDIDSACGPTGKAVYDAAQIADPEIDYSDYDTDKDGVVDFFMMIFAGAGGNGESQTSVPSYDNIWPHSSDLRGAYTDAATGLTGYISDDQLRDLEGRPLWYTTESRQAMTTTDMGDALKVFVRVGPYNVNPESAIAHASVISHEYGHSLGLPDYYSTGSRETYGSWSLMATDHSHNIDIVGKRELGWVVPRVLAPGAHVDATNWQDTKLNTHRIDWQQPDGTPYTLSGADVNNGEAYVAPLPARRVLDPADVPSGSHVYWSGSGDNFGCNPDGGHNLDIALPGLASVPAGTPVTLSFKSRFDIEWDFDYGFVMSTTDNGETYHSYPSENGYTDPPIVPADNSACQEKYGNGITGSSGSYEAGTQEVDRVLGDYPDPVFVDDSYDISDLAGKAATLRFSYATDVGLARPGWFIDDLVVKAGDQVIYESDFESSNDTQIYNGGCRDEGLQTAARCTHGWQYLEAAEGNPANHEYLLEMRDRSGFDASGHGEDDRDPSITFEPGVLLAYTDENHGYGNVGTDDPPAQSPLDSQPEPEEEAPNLDDAAFTAAAGDSTFSDSGEGHVDNYTDPSADDGLWRLNFKCLGFAVSRMVGTDLGPETQGTYNLNGDVAFDTGNGCAAFNYGATSQAPSGGGPTAVAQAKPERVQVGETVAFDGSASFDDLDAPEDLKYAWEFGDGKKDGGRQTTHVFTSIGTYKAELTVTDSDGNSDRARVEVKVVPSKLNRCKGLKGTIVGTPKADKLQGTKKRDVIIGLAGKDKLDGGRGRDVICGKGGADKRLSGGEKNDKIFGGGGKDRAGGGPGRDLVNGGAGRDRLSGGGGVDRVVGGPGRDKCSGSESRDRRRSCERSV